jgi:hypothetical protein
LREPKAGFDFLGFHYRWVPVRKAPRRRYIASCQGLAQKPQGLT